MTVRTAAPAMASGETLGAASDAPAEDAPAASAPVVVERSFAVVLDELIEMSATALAELQELRTEHRELAARARMTIRQAEAVTDELEGIEQALKRAATAEGHDAVAGLRARADSLSQAAAAVVEALRGGDDEEDEDEGDDAPVPLVRQLADANGLHQAFAPATEQERAALRRVAPALSEQAAAVNALLERMADFRDALDRAGVPWTPGRPLG